MLTISQLASYSGVTIRAVRHYHQVGLLPEPERDRSGYRNYDANAVVELIKIRTLADAGVPLAQIPGLLDADDDGFVDAVRKIDERLRAEITGIQRKRRQIAKLAAGDSLALPDEAVEYLDMLRDAGVSQAMIDVERDSWIIIAAQWPALMPKWMADKRRQFEDPLLLRLYQLIDPTGMDADDPRLSEVADLLAAIAEKYEGTEESDGFDDRIFQSLLDSFADRYAPVTDRLQELLTERGWTGWTHPERTGG